MTQSTLQPPAVHDAEIVALDSPHGHEQRRNVRVYLLDGMIPLPYSPGMFVEADVTLYADGDGWTVDDAFESNAVICDGSGKVVSRDVPVEVLRIIKELVMR